MKRVDVVLAAILFFLELLWFGALGVFNFYVAFLTTICLILRLVAGLFFVSDVIIGLIALVIVGKYIFDEIRDGKSKKEN